MAPSAADRRHTLAPQSFSPDGKWFLLSSCDEDPCDRSFLALDVERGGVLSLPIELPRDACLGRFGSDEPNIARWTTE